MQAQSTLSTFIQPAISAAPAAAGPRAPLDAGAPEKPFNQVLTQEIAGREQANQASASATPDKGNDAAVRQADTPADKTAAAVASMDKDQEDEAGTTANAAQDIASLSPALAAMMANLSQTQRDAALADEKGTLTDRQSEVQADAATTRLDPAALAAAAARHIDVANDKARLATQNMRGEMRDAATSRTQIDQVKDQDASAEVVDSGRAASAIDAAAASAEKARPQSVASDSFTTDKPPSAAFGAALQSASAAVASPMMPAAAATHLAPPVGTTAWDQALAQRVTWMVSGAEQSASLTLNPPELGPLQVILNLSHAQAEATFIASQPEVRQALEAALPKLREMLSEAGIQLGQASVSSGSPESRGQFSQQPRNTNRNISNAGAISASALPAAVTHMTSGRGLVDTFA